MQDENTATIRLCPIKAKINPQTRLENYASFN